MPWKKDDQIYTAPLILNSTMWFHPSGDKLRAAGYTWEDSAPVEIPSPDTTAFDAACAQFKQVCATIGVAIGNTDFKGGFDEYSAFIQSDFAQQNPAQAALYASMWSGANEYAKYEGAKLGYGQPAWWYKCWESTTV